MPTIEDIDGWLLVDRLFEDEPLVYPTGAEIFEETMQELHGGVMLVFPQPVLGEDVISKDKEELEVKEQPRIRKENMSKGWNIVVSRNNRYNGRGRNGAQRDGRTSDNIVRGNKT